MAGDQPFEERLALGVGDVARLLSELAAHLTKVHGRFTEGSWKVHGRFMLPVSSANSRRT